MQLRLARLYPKTVAAILLVVASGHAFAESGRIVANVDRILISGDAKYGGCMAALSVDPQTVLASCQPSWVTFSCSGDFTDRVRAYRMLDAAELALATGKRVKVYFSDEMKHNGYCFVHRIDVIR